jgi:hypothetical protein
MIYYDPFGSLVLQFGSGDIGIHNARAVDKDYENELVFAPQPVHVIGERNDEFVGKSSEDIAVPVRMIFDKVESLDAVADMLATLRSKIVARSAGDGEAVDIQSAPNQDAAEEQFSSISDAKIIRVREVSEEEATRDSLPVNDNTEEVIESLRKHDSVR